MPEESDPSISLVQPMSPDSTENVDNKRRCINSIDKSSVMAPINDQINLTEIEKKSKKCLDSASVMVKENSDADDLEKFTNIDKQDEVKSKAAENADANSKIDYDHATEYWNNVPATVNGMLGGFAHISSTDIVGSDTFLKWVFNRKVKPGRARCIDCGAGIGRITQGLLQRHFGVVDMVEQSPVFTDTAREKFAENPKVGNIFCSGLQDFTPEENIYDVVWIQWVLPYLPDKPLVDFLKRMSKSLKLNGVLCIKENVTSGVENNPKDYVLDEEDRSVTRPVEQFIQLANEAGLNLIRSVQQQKFPKQLFKVYMLAFKPEKYHMGGE